MPTIVLGGIALGTQVYSAAKQSSLAADQRAQALKLKKRDTTPGAFTEALDLSRMQADSRLPGQSRDENRIVQQTGNVSQAAVRAGATASQVQAALAGADMRGQSALADLGVRAQQFRNQAKLNYGSMLLKKGEYQRADQDAFDKEKAALLEGSAQNDFNAGQSISNGVSGAANIFATAQLNGLGRAGANGAIDALAPNQAMLGPTGLPTLPRKLPTTAIGQAPMGWPSTSAPSIYGRY